MEKEWNVCIAMCVCVCLFFETTSGIYFQMEEVNVDGHMVGTKEEEMPRVATILLLKLWFENYY